MAAPVNIKRAVCNAVANYLAANVTGLAGKVTAGQVGPEQETQFPSATIEPSGFQFVPEDPDEVLEETDGSIQTVGEFQGLAELKLYATTRVMREEYEQRITDLFLSQQDSPGTLYVDTETLTVSNVATLYSAQIKVRMESEDWEEEYTFENRRYSFIDLSFAYPALVRRAAVDIDSLQLALAGLTGNPVETIEIQEDGTIEPVS